MTKLKQAWFNFWFREQSTLPLDVFRICLGSCILQMLFFLYPDLLTWYGVDSWAPTGLQYAFHPDIFALLPQTDTSVIILFWISVAAACGITIGLKTRWCTVAMWLCLLSFSFINPFAQNSGDALMRICTFFLMFSPAGNTISVDRWIQVRTTGSGSLLEAPAHAPWAQRLIQLQVALVYWQAFWGKTTGQHWLDGTAVYYVTHLTELQRFYLPWIFDNLLMSKVLTWGTLILEACLWSLIWVRGCKYYVLAAGVLLHLGIEIAMNLPVFETLMVSTYVLFIEPSDLKRLAELLKGACSVRQSTETAPS